MFTKYSTRTLLLNRILELVLFGVSVFLRIFQKKKYINRLDLSEKNIILIEPYQLGDIISLSVMLNPLKKKFPKSNIYILTKSSNLHIYRHDNRIKETLISEFPWTDHGSFRYGSYDRWRDLYLDLQKHKHLFFDIGIETRGDVRSQFILNILNVKEIVGYTTNSGSNMSNLGLFLHKKIQFNSNYSHRYDSNCQLLTLLDIHRQDIFPITFPSYTGEKYSLTNKNKYIVIHVGGGWEFKRWRNKNWSSLINYINNKYDWEIHLIGGENERKIVEEIQDLTTLNSKLFFKITTFEELMNEIQNCSLFIGLDSGPLHIAECINKNVIGLYGPGNSELWKPYTENSRYIHNVNGFTCNPCLQKICIHPDNNCMDAIRVTEVCELIDKFKI